MDRVCSQRERINIEERDRVEKAPEAFLFDFFFRYLRPGDIYVHADLRGASSVVVR